MLKLIDQGLLSTKIDHYWKYSKYRKALGNHIEWIIENIKNSKGGYIRVETNDFIKELGSNFVINHYTSIFTGLRYSLFKNEDFGRIDAKGSKLLYYKGCYYWEFHKTTDFFFCIGYNDTRTEVISVYIPNENIRTNAIHINKNWSQNEDPYYWHKQDPKPWNDLFHTLKLEDCPVLKTRS